jgi:hypothetical protein
MNYVKNIFENVFYISFCFSSMDSSRMSPSPILVIENRLVYVNHLGNELNWILPNGQHLTIALIDLEFFQSDNEVSDEDDE